MDADNILTSGLHHGCFFYVFLSFCLFIFCLCCLFISLRPVSPLLRRQLRAPWVRRSNCAGAGDRSGGLHSPPFTLLSLLFLLFPYTTPPLHSYPCLFSHPLPFATFPSPSLLLLLFPYTSLLATFLIHFHRLPLLLVLFKLLFTPPCCFSHTIPFATCAFYNHLYHTLLATYALWPYFAFPILSLSLVPYMHSLCSHSTPLLLLLLSLPSSLNPFFPFLLFTITLLQFLPNLIPIHHGATSILVQSPILSGNCTFGLGGDSKVFL